MLASASKVLSRRRAAEKGLADISPRTYVCAIYGTFPAAVNEFVANPLLIRTYLVNYPSLQSLDVSGGHFISEIDSSAYC